MPQGGKRAEVVAQNSRARKRSQWAVRETNKDPQDDAPEASGNRRSARIRATKSALHPKEKDQLSPQQSHQQALAPKTSTRSRPGATTVPDSEGDTASAKPLAKKGKSKAPESRKSRQISRSSKPRRGRREGSESLEDHQALSREGLEQLTLKLGLSGAARDKESTYTSGTNNTDPREDFNYKYGYLPPLDEEASHIIAAIIDNPASAKKMIRIGPDSQVLFKKGLMQRNVETDPSESVDSRSEEIKSFSLGEFLRETAEQKQFCEHLWLRDIVKLSSASSEAIFQRTLMVDLIARHFLIYEKEVDGEQLLDFSAEEPWTCLPMPSRALWNAGSGLDVDEKLLTQPKPNLAICFKRKAVIKHGLWRSLPEATKELACFENQNLGMSRIFHFLAVETKNVITSLEDPKALYQSMNNASQALNNFYEFFQDAGPTHRQIFFDKIRFFSVVANTQGILIRIHRAIEISQDASRFELVMPDRPDYRLNFEYREFARLTGEDGFTRERVIEVFRKMLKYAVDELSVWITAAANDLLKKLDKNFVDYQAREKVGFYRHGQPSPKTSRNTSRTSRATSKSGKALTLAEQLAHAKVVSAAQSFVAEPTDGQTTSKASNCSNKRSISQVQIESTDSEESQVTAKRSRKAKGK